MVAPTFSFKRPGSAPGSPVPGATLPRRTALALLAGAVLARPGAACAGEFKHDYWFTIPDEPRGGSVRLRLRIAANGGARARGTVHLPGAEPPAALVATGAAQAVFAGGGLAGLTAEFRPAALDLKLDRDLVVLGLGVRGTPIAGSGTHAVDVTLVDRETGEAILEARAEAEVRVRPADPPRAPRRGKRRRGR
jgi:hypothetical protein